MRSITEVEVPADRAGLQDRQPRRGQLFRSRGKCDMDGRLILDLVVSSRRPTGIGRGHFGVPGKLPICRAAVSLLFGLVASGQIRLRKIDGHTKLATVIRARMTPAA